MTLNNNPWADIPTAKAGKFCRLRVSNNTKHALFWFRDDTHRSGLLIEISQGISHAILKNVKINIRDISIDIVQLDKENTRAFIIRLEEESNRDVFLKLCLDLIERVTASNETEEIFYIICGRLKKWQSLLSGKTRNLLSATEIQGLYSELYFIAEMLMKDKSRESLLIKGWEGPERIQHDFVLGDTAVEIKSVAGNQRGKVKISSEDQLDTHVEKLYLRVYFLSEIQDDINAESLNAIVRRIISLLIDKENRELFEIKLGAAGYIDIPDYDVPFFRVKDCRSYLVDNDFPRITRNTIPEGIEAVSYHVVLAAIEKYRIETEIMED